MGSLQLSRRALLRLVAASPLFGVRATLADQVAYDRVDRATVRVFAYEGVALEQQKTQSSAGAVQRRFAMPRIGHGSGVLLGGDGLILTARHVVAKARVLAVRVPDSSKAYAAKVVFFAKNRDYALIAIPDVHPDFLVMSDPPPSLSVRQTINAVGYPLDATRAHPQSSRGIVSGELPDGSLQLDISINPGNSGGPLIDGDERLVGVVVARGRLELGIQGLGVAVPMSHVLPGYRKVLEESRHVKAREELAGDSARALGADVLDSIVRTDDPAMWPLPPRKHKSRAPPAPSALRTLFERALASSPPSDVALLGAAYFWNSAMALYGEGRVGWRASFERALELGRAAKVADPDVEKHSPFLTYLLGPGASP